MNTEKKDPSSITIRDVARKAGVGVATVSRVLNNSEAVTEETRRRVQATIAELKYVPNPIAQQLSTGRHDAIAVTLPFLTYPSFVERLRGVQHALASTKFDLMLYSADVPDNPGKPPLPISKLRADGVLIISVPLDDSHVQQFLNSGLPVVLVDLFHPDHHRVFVDDIEGGRLATQHLVDLGHKRIAFLGDAFDEHKTFQAMRERFKGYRETLAAAGIPFRPEYHQQGPHGREEARVMAAALLDMDKPPTAIFAGSDTQAIGVLDVANERNIAIPQELSVVGYDGIRDSEFLDLTTVAQPLYESGIAGVELLLAILQDEPATPQEVRLPLALLPRGSTAAPRT
ncbi:MAG: LacI family DNA-binding transcriptional regulator [Chloroflexi bacterium]|nr:LacI family DNA-binding transcriptional regulator [Chloroflexota bacterium]